VSEQITAVSNSLIPFGFAVGFVAIVIWRAMEWAYRRRIDLLLTMHDQVAAENQIIKDRASRLEANDVSQKQEIAELRERVKDIPDLQPAIQRLSQSSDEAKMLLGQLGQANNAISEALSRAGTPLVLRSGRGGVFEDVVEPVYVPEDKKNKS
jgi:hypothetical protein